MNNAVPSSERTKLSEGTYLDDIAEQPDALVRHLRTPLPAALAGVDLAAYDRIVLTGMGSSHYSTIPVERTLAASGLPVLRMDSGQLLDVPQRVTPNTLLWATSQSGRSGELLALLGELSGDRRPRTVIGTTDDTDSPLAQAADVVVELRSGPEATVSTKSYLNTLAGHLRVLTVLMGGDVGALHDDLLLAVGEVRNLVREHPVPAELARSVLTEPDARVVFVGHGDDAATALTGALIAKESSKVAVEGYVGGAFRHGPLELAGPGLTAVLFGRGRRGDAALSALAADLRSSGSRVVTVGPAAYEGTGELLTSARDTTFARLATGMVRTQFLTVGFAQARGVTAGEFRFGRKITDTL